MSSSSGVETRNKKQIKTTTATAPATFVHKTGDCNTAILSPNTTMTAATKDNTDIKSLLLDLNCKIDHLRDEFQQQLKNLHRDIITDVHQNLLKALEEKVNHKISVICNSVTNLERRVDALERQHLSCDIVLDGIPNASQENVKEIFQKLCDSVEYSPPPIKDVFRVRPKSDKRLATSIIIKCHSARDKNAILRAASSRFKTSGKYLILRDIGIDSSKRFFMHESLTRMIYSLYRKVLRLKHDKKLAAVFSINGLVYVRKNLGDNADLIIETSDLKKFEML